AAAFKLAVAFWKSSASARKSSTLLQTASVALPAASWFSKWLQGLAESFAKNAACSLNTSASNVSGASAISPMIPIASPQLFMLSWRALTSGSTGVLQAVRPKAAVIKVMPTIDLNDLLLETCAICIAPLYVANKKAPKHLHARHLLYCYYELNIMWLF